MFNHPLPKDEDGNELDGSIHSFANGHNPPIKYTGMHNAIDVLTACRNMDNKPHPFHYEIIKYAPDGVYIKRVSGVGHRTTKEQMFTMMEEGLRGRYKKDTVKKERVKQNPVEVADKLMALWIDHLEGTRGDAYEQLCERTSGLLSLAALSETREAFKELEETLDLEYLGFLIGVLDMPLEGKEFKASSPKEGNATDRLWQIWCANSGWTKAEAAKQISERIFGILSLLAFPETRPIYEQLIKIIDFVDMCDKLGALSISGFAGGSQSVIEPFD